MDRERGRSLLVSIPPFGRVFQGLGVYRSDGTRTGARASFIVSMSPPRYPSARLRPRSAASVSPGKTSSFLPTCSCIRQ